MEVVHHPAQPAGRRGPQHRRDPHPGRQRVAAADRADRRAQAHERHLGPRALALRAVELALRVVELPRGAGVSRGPARERRGQRHPGPRHESRKLLRASRLALVLRPDRRGLHRDDGADPRMGGEEVGLRPAGISRSREGHGRPRDLVEERVHRQLRRGRYPADPHGVLAGLSAGHLEHCVRRGLCDGRGPELLRRRLLAGRRHPGGPARIRRGVELRLRAQRLELVRERRDELQRHQALEAGGAAAGVVLSRGAPGEVGSRRDFK